VACHCLSGDATLLRFLQTTYEAAAKTGGWNRAAMEYEFGVPRVPRKIHSPG